MKQNLWQVSLVVLLVFVSTFGMAQTQPVATPFTADSLASGNYKDVLSSFFKLSVDNLIGSNKAFSFTSNPYAVLAKMNHALLVDTNYYKYRALRNLNFAFALQLDESYHFNGFASAINFAVINRRDYTVSRGFLEAVSNSETEFTRLNDERNGYAATITDPGVKIAWNNQMNSFFTDSTYSFSQLDTTVQKLFITLATKNKEVHILKLIALNPNTSIKKVSQQNYDSIVHTFQNKHLLTIGVSDTSADNNFFFKKLIFSAESTKGFLNPNRATNVEWDIKAAALFNNDSTQNLKNLNRHILNVEPGFNFVFKSRSMQRSFVEFKVSGEYNHVFKDLYANENKDSLTINGTLRIRILNDLWIPLELKYNPKSGNIFGFLQVRFNFTGINKQEQTLAKE